MLRKAVQLRPRQASAAACTVSEGLCGAAVRSQRAGARGRRAEGPALREPRAGDPLGARGAARAQGPRDRGVRPRVARARPLHRGARQGADPAREPGRGGDRERAALRRDPQERRAPGSAGAADRPGDPARALPRGLARGAPAGRPRPTSAPRASSGGDLYDFYDMGGGPPRGRDRRRGRQGRARGALRGLRLGGGALAGLRAARAGGPHGSASTARLRRRGIEGLFCTLAYALFDFQERSLRIANSGLPHPLHYRAAIGPGGAARRLRPAARARSTG